MMLCWEHMLLIGFAGFVFVLYFKRMNVLQYKDHDWLFVLSNSINAGACLYTAVSVYLDGDLLPLRIFVPFMALIAYVESRRKFVYEKSVSEPIPLDEAFELAGMRRRR